MRRSSRPARCRRSCAPRWRPCATISRRARSRRRPRTGSRELGLGPQELATLVRAGELLRVADGVYLLPGADERALARLAELPSPFTLSAARQALGTTRRVAVPLLELLARLGHATRTADGTHRLR